MKKDALILVRGGGDLATGTIHRLWSAGLRVLVLEAEHPAAIRRQVSLCEAVYEGETAVEGLRAVRIETLAQAEEIWKQNAVPVLVDPQGKSIAPAKPDVLVDAILAKKNLGTTRDMAPLTIALGPGFTAGQDVDVVVETKRGHRLGRIIREGSAIPDTGIPGIVGGYGKERVIHAGTAGIFMDLRKIGDIVEAGETIAQIRTADGAMISVTTQITGILRGLLRSSYPVTPGFKVADIDPRKEELPTVFSFRIRPAASRAVCWNLSALNCGNKPVKSKNLRFPAAVPTGKRRFLFFISVAVAAILTYQPVLTQALGFLQTAALAVEECTVHRAIGVVNSRNTVAILEAFAAFFTGHQKKLFHGSFSFDFSIPERPARCKPHNACYCSTQGRSLLLPFWPKICFVFLCGCGTKGLDKIIRTGCIPVSAFSFLPLTLCRGSCLGV